MNEHNTLQALIDEIFGMRDELLRVRVETLKPYVKENIEAADNELQTVLYYLAIARREARNDD